jgi:pimeloyl-ACP methyl ester carboxylesterase
MNRRQFQIASLLAWGGSFAGATSGATPQRGADRATFLLVHGSWHSALHWHAVTAILAGRGCRVLAIDLPGHGLKAKFPQAYLRQDLAALATEPSPLKDVTLEDYVAAVVTAARGLARYGPVTVVGHSLGGPVINRAAEAIPELIHRLVYLTAYCPVRLPNVLGYATLPENAGSRFKGLLLGDPKRIGAIRINSRSADPAFIEEVRQSLYNDVPAQAFAPFAHTLTSDDPLLPLTADARGTRDRWGRVPRTFIRCTLDKVIPIALQDRMIREADAFTPENRFEVKTLAAGHSPFASQPEQLATILAGLA